MTNEEKHKLLDAALGAFRDNVMGGKYYKAYKGGVINAYNRLVEAINELAQQTRWIPVSERLPESSGVYIVSRWFSDGCKSKILTDACYFDGTSIWHNDIGINHSRDYLNEKIVAWMPLPEPYKAESEADG